MPNAASRTSPTTPDLLESEREALRATDYRRGHAAISLVESIRLHGYLRTALEVGRGEVHSYSTLTDGASFSRRLAPEHHRRVSALLALVAVACEDADERFRGHFKPGQRAQLHEHYVRHVDAETRAWARRQLALAAAEQLELF